MESLIALNILYEDNWIVVVDKPAGLMVHRSSIATNTDIFALQTLRNQLGYQVHPVHRLDRKTSGVLIFAKEKSFVSAFQSEMQSDSTRKNYTAIVRGYFPDEIEVDHPLTNDKGKIQSAQTIFKCLSQTEIPVPFGKFETSRYSHIQANPKTGRMHQIRKHLNHLRHPIIGDRPHGCNKQNRLFLEKWNLNKMLLHAESVIVKHPFTGAELKITAPKPEHYIEMLEILKL